MQKTAHIKKFFFPHVALLISTLIWALAGTVIKITLHHIPPITFLYFRFLIVCILILPYTIWELGKTKINPKDYLNFFLLGVFSQTAVTLVFFALKYTTVMDATIIGVLSTVLAVYAGHYFYKEKLSKNLTLGLVIASLGTFVVFLEPLLSGIKNHISPQTRVFGNFLEVIYALTWLMYVIWSKMSMGEDSGRLKKTLSFIHLKPMTKKYPSNLIVSMTFYIGLITLVPLLILEGVGLFGPYTFNLLALDSIGLLGLLYMAILSSITAYFLYQWGLENSHVSTCAIYGYLSPIFALPFAYIFLSEIPNIYMLLGGAFIAAGVIIAEVNNT